MTKHYLLCILFTVAILMSKTANANHSNPNIFAIEGSDSLKTSTKQQPVKLGEITISANRWQQPIKTIPQKVNILNKEKALLYQPQTSADLLETTGDIFIQKSQMGGGSPMIRGFSANSLLLVVDGIRMNNAIYRSGNLHNIIQIDMFSTSSTEIIYGPGSLIYGSDAIGGVISFKTIETEFTNADTLTFNGNATIRTSSANNEKTYNLQTGASNKKWSLSSIITYSKFGNLKMGTNGNKHNYLRNNYATQINGTDTILPNNNPYIQLFSGYEQINILEKIAFKINKTNTLTYTLLISDLGEVPRYDRLIAVKDDKLQFAEWYYGHQNWTLNSIQLLNETKRIIADKSNITVAFQKYNESRHSRNLSNILRKNQLENVSIWSINADYEKQTNLLTMFYGIEYYFNDVVSTASSQNIKTNQTTTSADTRYPNGNNYYHSAGIYLNSQFKIKENTLISGGLRYNHTINKSTIAINSMNLPVTDFNLNTGAFTFALGVIQNIENTGTRFSINISSGFRAPNIDDIGKVFNSEPERVIIPNSELQSEYANNAELSYDQNIFDRIFIKLTGFYTYVNNIMVRRPTLLNGQDSIMYDGEMSAVYTETNAAHANIYGVSAQLSAQITENLFIKQYLTFMDGKDSDNLPIRHIPPVFGSTRVEVRFKYLTSELFAQYNGKVSFGKLADSERSKKEMYATDKNNNPYSPAWWTLNYRIRYRLNKYFTVTTGIDNITDNLYRPYSSGTAAPGRNFIAALQVNF